MALYVTTEMMTTVIGYVDLARRSLRTECGLSLAEYRLLSLLCEQRLPVRPSDVTKALDISPAMTTLTANCLVDRGFVVRCKTKGETSFAPTKQGLKICQDADHVLEHVHQSLLSPLTTEYKDTIVVGTELTVMATMGASRMRDDSFFGEFATLQAFLIIEKVMTESTRLFGLPINGFRILFHLGDKKNGGTPGELAETLAIAPSAVTYAVKNLERNSLVERAAEKLDKRSVRVRITEQGADLLERTLNYLDPVLVSGIRNSSAGERKLIQQACELIAAAVRKQAAETRWGETRPKD